MCTARVATAVPIAFGRFLRLGGGSIGVDEAMHYRINGLILSEVSADTCTLPVLEIPERVPAVSDGDIVGTSQATPGTYEIADV